MLPRQAAAGRAADLHGLETVRLHLAAPVGDAAADVQNDFAQRGAERNFDQAGVGDVAGEREGFCAGRSGRAELFELVRALVDYADDVRQRLDVVDDGRLAPQSALSRERRLGPRHAALAFNRGNHRGLLAANERARAFHHFAVQFLAGAENIVAEKTHFLRVFDGASHARDGQRIFRADVNQRFVGADGARGDHQAFEHAVRIAFHHAAVHERAGIALVGIANHVFLRAFLRCAPPPICGRSENRRRRGRAGRTW